MNYSRRDQLARAFGAGTMRGYDWQYDEYDPTMDAGLGPLADSPSSSDSWDTYPSYDETSYPTEYPSIFNTDEQNATLNDVHGDTQRRDDIKRIQMKLKNIPIDPGPVDGIFGKKTCQAILEFQKNRYGTSKHNYLDYITFLDLGFDVHTADRFAKQYGWICGATEIPKSEAEGQAATGGGAVGVSDIKKIQNKLGVKADGKWGKATCNAIYALQAKTGIYTEVLRSATFEKMGFTASEAQKYAGAFSSVCAPYYVAPIPGGSDGNQVKVTEQDPPVQPKPNPSEPVTPDPAPPQKAGLGLWPLLGIGVAGVVSYYVVKKGKKKGRRR